MKEQEARDRVRELGAGWWASGITYRDEDKFVGAVRSTCSSGTVAVMDSIGVYNATHGCLSALDYWPQASKAACAREWHMVKAAREAATVEDWRVEQAIAPSADSDGPDGDWRGNGD